MMVRGECFRLPPWVQDTGVNAFGGPSGAWIEAAKESTLWPTATVHGNGNRSEYGGKSGDGLYTAVKRAAESALWPTPQATDAKHTINENRDGRQIMLIHAIRDHGAISDTWPTPTAHDANPVCNETTRDGLNYAVERGNTKSSIYPTVGTKTMGGCSGSFKKLKELEKIGRLTTEERRAMSSHLTGGKDSDTANCGMLNPDWVEWLMGWPFGWTDIAITYGVFYWLDLSDDPADWTPPLMQRITRRKKHRVPRIEMLGNGQVPLCAAVAFVWGFEILRVIVEGNEIGCVCKTKEGEEE